jgi:hypothetical protein
MTTTFGNYNPLISLRESLFSLLFWGEEVLGKRGPTKLRIVSPAIEEEEEEEFD